MSPELIQKYAVPVPRYTSYPTAPQFCEDVAAQTYEDWLAELPEDADLSLYVHIPFCETLCWYCGCTTKATRKYGPISDYLRNVINEMSFVTRPLSHTQVVRHIHWGGGSPNILSPNDILRLDDALRAYFNVAPNTEFAVEVDPRTHTQLQTDAFMQAGLTRLSVGVQDFDDDVQKAINRIQSFATTKAVIDGFRKQGIPSVNMDLVYGLPCQTMEKAERTIDQVVELQPDRIALFGYAHLPSRISHQKLIRDEDLPDPITRFEMSQRLADHLTTAGYVRIGLDHFALPMDPLATRAAKRNFQGYTHDDCQALVGIGASAIGRLPQGYVQNAVATHDYNRRVRTQGLAAVRGHALNVDDRMRAFIIERIMCDLAFPAEDLRKRFGASAAHLFEIAAKLVANDTDGLVQRTGDGFSITSRGRPFVRTIASAFDAYLDGKGMRYSLGV